MKKSHITPLCKHEMPEWCIHCEEGCLSCGILEGIDDDSYCEKCAFDRAIVAAEYAFEGDR